MRTDDQTHILYLRQRDYPLRDSHLYTPSEKELLVRYGYWMQALTSGTIPPLTDGQSRFLKVDRGEAEAETAHEQAWQKMKRIEEATAQQAAELEEQSRRRNAQFHTQLRDREAEVRRRILQTRQEISSFGIPDWDFE